MARGRSNEMILGKCMNWSFSASACKSQPEAFQPLQVQTGSNTPWYAPLSAPWVQLLFALWVQLRHRQEPFMGGGESLSEILQLELSSVHFVRTGGLILDR